MNCYLKYIEWLLNKTNVILRFDFPFIKFKNCMHSDRKTTGKFLLVLQSRKESLLFMQNIFMPKISSHINFFRISNIDQTWFNTCQKQRRKRLKNRDFRTVLNSKYTKYNASLVGMAKHNSVYGRRQKTKLY